VQKRTVGQPDRDWRYVGVILPVEILSFTANNQTTAVVLKWEVITQVPVAYFEILRSTDNIHFETAGVVNDEVIINQQQEFVFTDNSAAVNNDMLYYRLKVIGKNGDTKYSNTLVVKKSALQSPVTIMPNPAKDYVMVRFYATKESPVIIRLINETGKTVLVQNRNAAKGINTIMMNNLAAYGSGFYTIQVLLNNDSISQRIILTK
jgi:Secretion system C-terminal sorting domain